MSVATRPTQFGRYHVAETSDALCRLHFHHESIALKEVDHEPKVAVLDQEDLLKQGIHTSAFIPGASDVDALGSCTCNTLVEALSNVLTKAELIALVNRLLGLALATDHDIYSDTKTLEMLAVVFYHQVTDQTGAESSEWPPTDCGSSGPYLYAYALAQKLIRSEQIAAHTAESIVSLMQSGGLLLGTPWLAAWMQPGPNHFIDGNGSALTLETQVREGVAGGHEIYLSAIEKLTLTLTGKVDPTKTVLRLRNHWTKAWSDQGSAYVHLSTLLALGNSIDLRQFAV